MNNRQRVVVSSNKNNQRSNIRYIDDDRYDDEIYPYSGKNRKQQDLTGTKNQRKAVAELRIKVIKALVNDVANGGNRKREILREYKEQFGRIMGSAMINVYSLEEENIINSVILLIKNRKNSQLSEKDKKEEIGWFDWVKNGISWTAENAASITKTIGVLGESYLKMKTIGLSDADKKMREVKNEFELKKMEKQYKMELEK